MKKIITIISVLSVISLTACQENYENKVTLFQNGDLLYEETLENKALATYADLDKIDMDDYLIEVSNFENVLSMIDRKESFVYLVESRSCIHCKNVLLNLLLIVSNYKIPVYYSNYFEIYEKYIELVGDYSNIFDVSVGTPQIYFIKNGNLLIKGNQDKFTNYSKFTDYLNQETYVSTASMQFTKYDSFKKSLENDKVIVINSASLYLHYTEHIKESLIMHKSSYKVFDIAFSSDEDLTNLRTYLGVDSNFLLDYCAFTTENKIIKEKADYVNDGLNSFLKILDI